MEDLELSGGMALMAAMLAGLTPWVGQWIMKRTDLSSSAAKSYTERLISDRDYYRGLAETAQAQQVQMASQIASLTASEKHGRDRAERLEKRLAALEAEGDDSE